MSFEQDYIMRMIKQLVKFLSALILGKTASEEQQEEDMESTGGDTCTKLIAMADNGQINEAENLLYESLDSSNIKSLQTAMTFYGHLSEYPDDYLEEHNYTKEEILEGLKEAAKKFGLTDIINNFLS